jgi:hypothetical protein
MVFVIGVLPVPCLLVAVIILLTGLEHRPFRKAAFVEPSAASNARGRLISLKFSFALPVKYKKKTGGQWCSFDTTPLLRESAVPAKKRAAPPRQAAAVVGLAPARTAEIVGGRRVVGLNIGSRFSWTQSR